MNVLEHAINIEGSKVALALALGCTPSIVTYWDKKGLPKLREMQLKALYGRRKAKPKPPSTTAQAKAASEAKRAKRLS